MRYLILTLALVSTGVHAKGWPVVDGIEKVKAPVAKVARTCSWATGVNNEFGKMRNNPCKFRKVTEPLNKTKRQMEKLSNLSRQFDALF